MEKLSVKKMERAEDSPTYTQWCNYVQFGSLYVPPTKYYTPKYTLKFANEKRETIFETIISLLKSK